jgi:hypothetical protein
METFSTMRQVFQIDHRQRTLQKSNGKPNGPFTAHYIVEMGGKRLVNIPSFDKAARTIFMRQ